MKRSWLFLLQCAYLILSFHLSCIVVADDALVMQAGQGSSFEDFYEDEEVNQDLLREVGLSLAFFNPLLTMGYSIAIRLMKSFARKERAKRARRCICSTKALCCTDTAMARDGRGSSALSMPLIPQMHLLVKMVQEDSRDRSCAEMPTPRRRRQVEVAEEIA